MTSMRQASGETPAIGLTCSTVERAKNYIRGIELAGGQALPLTRDFSKHAYNSEEWLAELRAYYKQLDGLLLSGGGDMDPEYYGEKPLLNAQGESVLYDVFPERDAMEMQLCRWALDDDMPLFGICRGHQLLNVVMGGTLYQDVRLQRSPTHPLAKDFAEPWTAPAHVVTLTEGSKLARILETLTIETNSLHHQAVKDVGAGLHQSGVSGDFINEANESPDRLWCLSVQFHPEGMLDVEPRFRKLFRSFVAAARSYGRAKESLGMATTGR